jgi:epoxyqueuosine reductase
MDLVEMLQMSQEEFLAATRASAIRRAGYGGFLRNVAIAMGNSGDGRANQALIAVLDHPEPLVRGHVAWALGRLGSMESLKPLRVRLDDEEEEAVNEEIRWALNQLETAGPVAT